MTYLEELKARLQLAARSTNVRLGQNRDHLIWTDYIDSENGPLQSVAYIFHLDDGRILEIYPEGDFTRHPSERSFLRDVESR